MRNILEKVKNKTLLPLTARWQVVRQELPAVLSRRNRKTRNIFMHKMPLFMSRFTSDSTFVSWSGSIRHLTQISNNLSSYFKFLRTVYFIPITETCAFLFRTIVLSLYSSLVCVSLLYLTLSLIRLVNQRFFTVTHQRSIQPSLRKLRLFH